MLLTLSTTAVDYGSIQLPEPKPAEIAAFAAKVQRLEEITARMQDLSALPEEEITPQVANEVKALADEAKELMNQLFGTTFGINNGSGLPAQPDITLTLSSNPSNLGGAIGVLSERITAIKPGAVGNTLGEYRDMDGVTKFVGSLELNGNYGVGTYQGAAGGVKSNGAQLRVTGQTKEEAERELRDLLDEISDLEQRAIDAINMLVTAMAAVVLVLVGVGAFFAPALLLAIIAAVAALYFAQVASENIDAARKAFRKLRNDIEDNARPLINELPVES